MEKDRPKFGFVEEDDGGMIVEDVVAAGWGAGFELTATLLLFPPRPEGKTWA